MRRPKLTKTFKQSIKKMAAFFSVLMLLVAEWPGFMPKPDIPILMQSVYAAQTTYSSGSGTYSVPAGTTSLVVELWGAGGGGAGGGGAKADGNGGGGGGAYAKKTISSPSSSYSYSVGTAGSGGAAGSGGNPGGDTTFGSTIVVAKGGSGGNYSSGGGGTGGAGGTGSTGDTTYNGGTGGTGSGTYSGGGGGGAGSTGNGGNASGTTAGTGTSENGGNGGAGTTANNGSGNSGNNYGGGGASSTNTTTGASGAGGYIRITSYATPTVTTQSASDISYNSITGNGNITSAGDPSTVTRRGFCYMTGTSGDPTTANSVAYDDGTFGTGSYTKSITGLTESTNYRVRAYAVNATGTSYGTTVQVTTTAAPALLDLSGTIYQSSNESLAYDCSGGNARTILLKVNGSGSYSGTCDQNTGAWSVSDVGISSGDTVIAYISGVSVAGSTVMVSNGSAQTNVPIIVNRVVMRDDANGTITGAEVAAGNTSDAEDLITLEETFIVVGSSYETHIVSGDTFDSTTSYDFKTGKLHLVGNFIGNTESGFGVLRLTGSGTGTSQPLYIDGGTFTPAYATDFTGTSNTDIPGLAYNQLDAGPTISGSATYNISGSASAPDGFYINATSTGVNTLTVNMGGDITTGYTQITGTDSGLAILNTTTSNYTLTTGRLDIQAGGTLTANDSNIYLTGTFGTLFTKTGAFNQGTSAVYFQPTSGSPTLTSGTITFYDMIVNMSGQTGALGGSTTVGHNLTVSAGTLSKGSTYSLTVNAATSITGTLAISGSTGDVTLNGTTTINNGGTYTQTKTGGTNTFGNLLTIANGGTYSASGSLAQVILNGGISNSGSFTSGGSAYFFEFDFQSISGSAATTFDGPVTISSVEGAITLSNINTNTVTFNSTFDVEASSQYENGTNATTNFAGGVTFYVGSTISASANPNTIYFTGDSMVTFPSATYHHLYIQPSVNSASVNISAITVNGNLTLGNGTNTGVVISATMADPNISVLGDFTVNANTTFTSSDSASATLNIDGDLTIAGTFTAPVGTNDNSFTLGGSFIKTGTFNNSSGQLTLDSTRTAQLDYSSDTTFYQLKIAPTSGTKNVQFDETYTTIVANDLTIQGTNCATGKVYLDSLVNDSPWAINIQTGATQSITYIDLEDADGSGSQETPTALDATETGTNTGWDLTVGICIPAINFEGINLSGVNIN